MGTKTEKGIFALSTPLVISFWLRAAFQWIDPAFATTLKDAAGNSLGDASLAAIGLTLPFEFLMTAVWVGASNGLTSHLAAAMGSGNNEQVEKLKGAARKIIWVLNGAFLLLAFGIAFLAEKVGLDPVVATQFRIYATILVGGSAFTSFWSILPDSLVKAHHDTRTTMWAGILSTVLNVLLNTIFTFVLEWGIFGIAFSTVLGRLAGLGYALYRAALHEERRIAETNPEKSTSESTPFRPVYAILAIAFPSGMAYVLMALESQIINFLLARLPDATSQLAAWTLFERGVRFLGIPLIATSVAMLPLVARRFGQKDTAGIRKEIRLAQFGSAAYTILLVLPIALFLGPWVAGKLSGSPQTESAVVATLWLIPLAVFVMIPVMLLRAVFDGIQKPRAGLFVALIRAFLLVGPLVWLGIEWAVRNGHHPTVGAAWGFSIGVGAASILLWFWLQRELKKQT